MEHHVRPSKRLMVETTDSRIVFAEDFSSAEMSKNMAQEIGRAISCSSKAILEKKYFKLLWSSVSTLLLGIPEEEAIRKLSSRINKHVVNIPPKNHAIDGLNALQSEISILTQKEPAIALFKYRKKTLITLQHYVINPWWDFFVHRNLEGYFHFLEEKPSTETAKKTLEELHQILKKAGIRRDKTIFGYRIRIFRNLLRTILQSDIDSDENMKVVI